MIRFVLSVWLSLVVVALAGLPPRVVQVSPAANAIQADWTSPLLIQFDQPLDPASISSRSVRVFGRWSGPHALQLALADSQKSLLIQHTRPFFAGELITVFLSRSIRSQTGDSLGHGFAYQFWSRSLPGSMDLIKIGQRSVRRPGEGPIQTYGVYAGDLDGDGDSDIAAPNEISHDVRVFLNPGNGAYDSLTVFPLPGGARPSTNEGADFDDDGHVDLAVGNSAGNLVSVLLGDGQGGFLPETTYPVGRGVRGLAILDLNGDGLADIATANRDSSNVSLLLNLGNSTFGPAVHLETGGQQETACVSGDFNEDGILDLAVGNRGSEDVVLLLGDGQGGLQVYSQQNAGGSPWMVTAGDVNGDGHLDVLSANANEANASVLLGDGQGNLSNAVVYPVGSFPLAIDVGDLDGDGDLDLVVSSFSARNWSVYENDGSGQFVNRRILTAQQAGSCAVLHDFDNDGDLDMTGIDEIADLLLFFQNQGPVSVPLTPEPASVSDFQLEPNFPNPFNPETHFSVTMVRRGRLHLDVLDSGGRLVQRIADRVFPPGRYRFSWDGKEMNGQPAPSGVYFLRARSEGNVQVRQMVLVR
ncbi:MAG: hypothetical protein D6715_09745 [Calditrichaeota bacterium]|nr:MAG: hypothetical protein D6715_09745 [Calditrichota bacterium]